MSPNMQLAKVTYDTLKSHLWISAFASFATYLLLRSFYRLYLHPLRKIPGSKLAAITHGVEFYYDVVVGGMYIWEIEKMHEKYGPIVRINPRQVHIKDSDYYDEIYAGGNRKRDKDPAFPPRLSASLSVISTVPHDHHRVRRSVLNAFFSKKAVTSLEPILQEKVDKLSERFIEAQKAGTVLALEYAFAALTSDVITHYCYGASYRYLDDNFPENDLKDAFAGLFLLNHILYFFPVLSVVLNTIPPWIMSRLDPKSAPLANLRYKVQKQSAEELKSGESKGSNTIFNALVDPKLPPKERTLERLVEEGIIVLGAGAETTANTMCLAAFYLMKERSILLKLREELKDVMPAPHFTAPWSKLEQLPYLTAVVNESLRVAVGGSWRLPRCAPNEVLVYKDYVIPKGTPMISSHYFVHMDPKIFPNPHEFRPERWIEATERGQHLGKYIVSFSKGSRGCVGINLAYAELYLVIARFARQFEMALFKTTEEDISFARDFVIPHTETGQWSVKALVKGAVEE